MSGYDHLSTDDLMRIATCGGGFSINAGPRSIDDLMKIANCAGASSARITLTGMHLRSTADLMRIATCGKGCVVFA